MFLTQAFIESTEARGSLKFGMLFLFRVNAINVMFMNAKWDDFNQNVSIRISCLNSVIGYSEGQSGMKTGSRAGKPIFLFCTVNIQN